MDYPSSRQEREILIGKINDEDCWDVYTSSPIWARRLEKIAKAHGVEGTEMQGGIRYKLPIKAVSLRKPRVLSEKQKEQVRAMRESRGKT